MSTATIASLVVSLEANIARFSTDIKSAADTTKSAMATMESAAGLAKKALGALAGVVTVDAVVGWSRGVINAAAALDDFSESTGSSVESLSQLTNQAKVAGVSADVLQTAINKLAAGMNGADDETTKVGKALAQLGITAKDPAAAFREIATTIDQYADGAGKAAFLADVFGKNWAAVLPALRAVVEEQDVAATVTAQQAAEAERLNKETERLSVGYSILKTALLSDLVPAMARMAEGFRIARSEGLGFFEALNTGSTYADRLQPKIEQTNKTIDDLRKKIAGGEKYGFSSWVDDWMKDLKTAEAELRTLVKIRDGLISRNVAAMGWTGDARDLAAGNFGGKPALDYKSQADAAKEAKQAVADYTAEIQRLNDELMKVAGGGGGYDNYFRAYERYAADLAAGKAINIEQTQALIQTALALDNEKAAQARLKVEIDAATKAHEAEVAALDKLAQAANDALGSFTEENDLMARSIALIGADERARNQLAATIAYERAQKALDQAGDVERLKILDEQYRRRQALIDQMADRNAAVAYAQEWGRALEGVSRSLSDFFVDLVENGSSAFKRLWDNFKRWALEALAQVAAKQVVVSVVGAVSGVAAGNAAAQSLGGTGGPSGMLGTLGSGLGLSNPFGAGFSLSQNTWGAGAGFGGSAGSAFSALGGGAAIGGLIGAGGAALFGNGQNNSAMQLGGTIGGAIGAAVAGPVGAVVGSVLGTAIGGLTNREGDAMRKGTFVSGANVAAAKPNSNFISSGAFGAFGIVNDKWFSDEMAPQIQQFLGAIATIDNAIASTLDQATVDKVKANLDKLRTEFEAGMERTGATFGDIVRERYAAVVGTIDQSLGALISGFKGTDEALGTFIVDLVQVYQGLKALDIKGLDIPALQAMAQSGETLAQTFNRVGGAYAQFVDAFTTDAERLASAQTAVTDTFASLGLAIPTSVTAYRELVQSLDLSTDSGRTAFQQLLGVSGAFLMVQKAAEAAGTAVDGVAKSAADLAAIERQRGNLEAQLLELQGDAAGATALRRRLELEQMDASLRPLQERIYALQDEKAASDAATKAAKESADALLALVDGYKAVLADTATLLDPMSAAQSANATPWQTLTTQGNSLATLTAYFDNTAAATDTLRQATQAYGQTLIQTIGQIEQLKGSIAAMFESTIRGYTLDGLDAQGKYAYLQQEVNAAMAELATAMDPTRIQALAQLINADQQQAYGLLSNDQKAAARQEFIDGAKAANDLVQQRLQAAEDAAIARNKQLVDDLRAVLMEASATEQRAANTMLAAANKMDGAQITVRVTDPQAGTVGSY